MPFGQFEFVRMPFGLTNAPRTFQRAMNAILGHLPFVRVYLDDILIMGESEDIHNKNLHQVLTILKENGITINLSKSKFFKTEVEYLGTIIDANGIRPITTKLAKYDNFQEPRTVKDLQSLLGFINWF
ncbi:Transposon Tf2 [Pseudoloma neurophilia]|uniref:Transposon Tf2 n=1 Tax=Pseudoloma neurophilia TaxID=146866 RepID=A0A0R0M497_9MICR|nr:Transposon Tf2 [Pseudoloma neurophilia]